MQGYPSPFDALKRPPLGSSSTASYSETFYFQLRQNQDGESELHTVSEKNAPVTPDYRAYSGPKRDLLKTLAAIKESASAALDWGADGTLTDNFPLRQHPALLGLMARCDNTVDTDLKPIRFESTEATLALLVEPTADASEFESRYTLQYPSRGTIPLASPEFITDSYLREGSTLHRLAPQTRAPQFASLFSGRVPHSLIDSFLTLFVSNCPAIPIRFQGYTYVTGDPIPAVPALVFREVDADSTLHLNISEKLPNLPIDFVRDYEISRIAHLDPDNHVLRVSEVTFETAHKVRAELLKQLARLSRSLKTESSFLVEEYGEYFLGADLARNFLTQQLASIAGQFALFGAEKLKKYKITHSKPKLRLSLGSGIDFLEGNGEIEIDGENIPLLDALQQYRKNAYIQLSDGNQAVLDPSYIAQLERIFKKRKNGLRISFFDLPLIEELMEDSAAAQLPPSRSIFQGFNTLQDRRAPLPRFQGQLRPYQNAGVKWLDYLHEHKLGGCLADDMGLGKTVQAIALLTGIYPKAKSPTLIAMPRSLLFNWARELATFAPSLKAHIHYATGRDWEQARQNQIILTTYGTLRSDVAAIAQTQLHAVILDESQAIKNLQTQTAQAALALKAKFRLALSGTPVENNLGELYTLFRFLNPAMFNSQAEFERDYATPIQKQNDTEAAHELRKKTYPFILRRLKGDVLKDLPPKVEQILYVEMGKEQKAHYEQRRRFYQDIIRGEIKKHGVAKSQFVILEAMLELRQIASVPESKTDGRIVSAKRERLIDALEEAVANGRKCLVFSNFLAGIELAGEALNERSIPYVSMTGTTSNREALVERFQNDNTVKAFVMTLKTGGVGLNLTAADTVFILDPWWNTSAESQAVDRAHRIGQLNTVFTYRLIARDTIEEKIMLLQQQKKDIVDQIVTADSGAFKSLTETDIDLLFKA